MKEERVRNIIFRWIIPGGAFIAAVTLLLVRFSSVSQSQEQEKIERNILTSAEYQADEVYGTLYSILMGSDIVASYMVNGGDEESLEAVVKSIQGMSLIYDYIFFDADGRSYHICGEDLTEEEIEFYGELCKRRRGMDYLYSPISGTEEFMVVSHIDTEDAENQYIICLYNLSGLEKVLRKNELYARSFYVLMTTEGRVLTTLGQEDKLSFTADDYLSALRPKLDSITPIEIMKARMKSGNSCVLPVSAEGEKRTVALAPVGLQYYLVVGVDQEYVDLLVENAWMPVLSIAWQLMGVLVLFVTVVVIVNIVAKIRSEEKKKSLQNKADTDQLTGLYNKIATEKYIKEHLKTHPDEKAMMILLDVDNFKRINDTMGHAFGDEVLQTLGRQIRAEFRASDILGRIGGDEFMILLCNMKDTGIIRNEAGRIERFFKQFQAGEYVKYSVTASIGVSVYPEDGNSFEDLYKNADSALYMAKNRGKNQLAFYGDDTKDTEN